MNSLKCVFIIYINVQIFYIIRLINLFIYTINFLYIRFYFCYMGDILFKYSKNIIKIYENHQEYKEVILSIRFILAWWKK